MAINHIEALFNTDINESGVYYFNSNIYIL